MKQTYFGKAGPFNCRLVSFSDVESSVAETGDQMMVARFVRIRRNGGANCKTTSPERFFSWIFKFLLLSNLITLINLIGDFTYSTRQYALP